MVVAAHLSGIPPAQALAVVLPVLEAVRARCAGATTAAEVIASLDQVREGLRKSVRDSSGPSGPCPSASVAFGHPDLGPDHIGGCRVFHQLEHGCAPFLRSRPRGQRSVGTAAPQHLRLPSCGDSARRVLEIWFGLLDSQVDPSVPVLLAWPQGGRWVDAVIGEPVGSQFFFLRAGEAAAPLVTSVPFDIQPGYRERVERALGGVNPPLSNGSESSQADPIAPAHGSIRFVLVVLGLIFALAIALFVLLGAGPLPEFGAAGSQPTAAKAVDESTLRAESTAIRAAWDRQSSLARDRAAKNPADHAAIAEKLGNTRRFLERLDLAIPREVRRVDPQPAWLAKLNLELVRARERRLARAFRAWDAGLVDVAVPGVTNDLSRVVEEVRDLYGSVASFADDMFLVERMLDLAYGLREPLAGEAAEPPLTIDSLVAPWAARLANEPSVRASLSPVLDRVESLRAIEAASSGSFLLSQIGAAAESPPEAALAAWRRLGSRSGIVWPAAIADLDAEVAASQRIRDVVAKIDDAARRETLYRELRTERTRRFVRFISLAPDAKHVDAGFARMSRFDVDPQDLEPWIRYNLGVHNLREAVRLAADDADDAALRVRIGAFMQQTRGLPSGVEYRSDVATLLSGLRDAMDGKEPATGPRWWETIGPASTGRYSVERRGNRLIFTPKPGVISGSAIAAPLTFVLVQPDKATGVAPFYMGRTEVSVVMFNSIRAARATQASHAPPGMNRYLAVFDRVDDPRLGPRSWEWNASRTEISPARDWMFHFGRAPQDEYAPGCVPPRPSFDSPMQHVSPKTAVYFASLAGCRLPTPGEWQAAAAQVVTRDPATPNLRDQTWLRQFNHVEAQIADLRPVQQINAGSFEGVASEPVSVTPADDRALWFEPAAADEDSESIRHLIGNVAEFVLNADSAAAPVDPRDPAADAFFQERASDFAIIGGSSLSDPTRDAAAARPVNLAAAVEGYSDVGFRLAFSSKFIGPAAESLAGRVHRLLESTPYLRGK